MIRTSIAAASLVALLSGQAGAWPDGDPAPAPMPTYKVRPSANASSSGRQAQTQNATADATSKASARSRSSSGASAATGPVTATGGPGGAASQDVTVNGAGGGYGGQTSLFLPPNPGTSECIKGFGIGVNAQQSGGLLSYAWHEGTCEAMREGMQFWNIGLRTAAYGRWCQDDTLAKAIGRRCHPEDTNLAAAQPVSAPVAPKPVYCNDSMPVWESRWHPECG